MAGKDVAGVLHAARPLDHGFHEVAERAEEDGHYREANPLIPPKASKIADTAQRRRSRHRQHKGDDEAFHRLLRGDALAQLVQSEKAAGAIGQCVIQPDDDEHGEDE